MKDTLPKSDEDFQIEALPETLLWLAVIDRAIVDYVDPPKDLPSCLKSNLYQFIYSQRPEPFNLSYLSIELFGDPIFGEQIRKRIAGLIDGSIVDDGFHLKAHRHHGGKKKLEREAILISCRQWTKPEKRRRAQRRL